jgi:hypothetical protein
MTFLTIDDCRALGGPVRDLLRSFDHRLRDILAAAQHEARELDARDERIQSACLTVMMSVVASAALLSSEGTTDVTDERFAAISRDAFMWAKRSATAREDQRARWLRSLFWPPAPNPDRSNR